MPVPAIPESTSPVTYPVKIHSLSPINGKKEAVVNISKDATVGDVIDSALEEFSIHTSTEHFDLCEVFSDFGDFSNVKDVILDNSRTLSYSESPISIVESWDKNNDNKNENESYGGQSNGTNKQSFDEVFQDKNNHRKYRFYLNQKIESILQGSDVKVTWLEGLNPNIPPEDWHFDPFYRESGEIDDLVDLPVLTETVLLDELCRRFCRGRIYTYVGGILIAVNPFKYFPIYNPKYVHAYQHRKLGELPPHVFAIADAAYLQMLQDKHNQCIVISGESGSGKTESTKLILHHLTALSHKTKASVLEKTILAAGPVLEAFGNAKTCHNNNSSRFGKFTQINYRKDGVVCGAILKKYLLEKSRIVSQAKNERNYHVFYNLLYGASTNEKDLLHLGKPEDYHYLNQSDCHTIDGNNEAYKFQRLRHAIRNIGLHSSMQQRMFAVLSAVLHIGNIEFKKKGVEDSVTTDSDEGIDIIAKLLQVEKRELVEPLTSRKTITRGEEFIRFYKKDEAIATRDSMAKCLYAALFDWIVLQTNHIMSNRHGRKTDKMAFSIGVLDIFGFEDFEINSFEQFCINLANENLQYYLNQHIFKLRQDEYIEEGLHWDQVVYADNFSCLDLMVGKPTGLILLLDEECSLTMGTDESLLEKFNRHHANHPVYEMPPKKAPVFSIKHYAGRVKYHIKDFRAKNRDLMRNDIVMTFKNSRMLFMRELMGSDPVAIYYWSILRHMIKAVAIFKRAGIARAKGEKLFDYKRMGSWTSAMTPPNRRKMFIKRMTEKEPEAEEILKKANRVMNRRVPHITRMIQSPSKVRSGLEVKRTISGGMTEVTRRGGLKQPPTVVAQFQSSLLELMETLNKSHPFFVRCIRSNAQKEPLEFDAELVLRQLRYTGMLETVKIRQAGYPSRILIKDFISQFKLMFPKSSRDSPSKDELKMFLKKIGLDDTKFQVGETKVFMKESQYRLLKQELQKKLDQSARKIQLWTRSILQRRRYIQMKEAAVVLQKHWRGYKCRQDYKSLRLRHYASLRIQEFWKASKRPKEAYVSYFDNTFKRSVVLIQALFRGHIARKRYIKMLKEKREEEEKQKIATRPVEILRSYHVIEQTSRKSYSMHKKRKKKMEDAEHMMKDVLKGTIFYDECTTTVPATIPSPTTAAVPSPTTTTATNLTPSSVTDGFRKSLTITPSPKAKSPIYAEISDFDEIYKKASADYIPGDTSNTATVLKLRADSGVSSGSDVDRNSENFKQKLYRRLSFSSKDKERRAHPPFKKAKEAEDYGFEIIKPDDELLKVKSWKPSTGLTLQPHTPPRNTFADFFNSLNRKNSKKGTPKTDRKPTEIRVKQPAISETGYLVHGENELQVFNSFLTQKVSDMNKGFPDQKCDSYVNAKGDAEVDLVFKNALHKYHGSLLFNCANTQIQHEEIKLKYADLVNGFEEVLDQMVKADEKVPIEFCEIGSNLFRGIIEEYERNKEKLTVKWEKKKPPKPRRKKKKKIDYIDHNGHCYYKQTIYITTYCEYCNAIIHDGFGLKCQVCHFTCHKKCYNRYTKSCKGRRPSVCGPSGLFGTDLSEITSPNNPIPLAVIKILNEIEKRGLYAVGLYRKPGLQAAVNNLKSVLTSIEADDLILEDEKPHTLASLVKLFFRQLPRPVVLPEFYEDFIRSADLEIESEMHTTLYELIQRFPDANKSLFERMIVHLARVAHNEDSNKMSPNGLAIIWAPCFLRPSEDADPLEALQSLPKQTKCIEVLIDTQLRTRRKMLKDISVLEEATTTAVEKLDILIKEHSLDKGDDESTTDGSSSIVSTADMDIIASEISFMEDEKNKLTQGLANMEPHKTRSLDSIDDLGSETDIDAIRGSFEELNLPVSPSQQSLISTASDLQTVTIIHDQKSSKFLRMKFAEGNDSSFEDINDVSSGGDTIDRKTLRTASDDKRRKFSSP